MLSPKQLAIVLAVLIVIVIIIVVIWKTNVFKFADTTSSQPATVAEVKAQKQSGQTLDPTVVAKANAEKVSGNPTAAVDVYTKAIASNTDKDEKVALYINKATLQASNGDAPGAIVSAKQAETLAGSTLTTASLLASVYKQNGDKTNAVLYFRKSADLVADDTDGSSLGEKQYYLDQATALEAAK